MRRLIELHRQLGLLSIQAQQLAAAHQAIQAAYAQAVARFGAVHVMQVLEATAAEQHAVGSDKVAVFQQQQVPGCAAGGWSLVELSLSSVAAVSSSTEESDSSTND